MSAKAACCFVENGNPCDCGGVYRVTLDQLERTVAAKRAKKQPELLYDYFVTCDDEEYWVCAEHAYDVIKAHLRETYEVAKGKARMERRDLIKEVLWCTGTHENQDPDAAEKLAAHIVESNAPPKPDTPRRVSRPTGDHPVVGDDKVMKLRKLFDRALPFIHVQSFTYVLLITMLRSVLILNGIFEYGRHVWHGDKEGTDFLRFCAVLYTVVGAPGIELLRGGARDETGGALFAAVEAADADLVALMCDSGGSPLGDDKDEGDALIHACKMRYHDVVVALVSRGADVYRTFHEFDDATPMMWAIEPTIGRPRVEHEWVPDEALAKLLVEHGCDVDRLQGPGMKFGDETHTWGTCLLYTSPSPRDATLSRMPSSA